MLQNISCLLGNHQPMTNFKHMKLGATSDVYYGNDMVVKHVTSYKKYGPFAREVCVLDKLKLFAWSPKIVCIGSDYIVMTSVGDPQKSCANYPTNYIEQIKRIVADMKSINIRHNDMLKDTSDIVIDSNGMVHLTDFGWATFNDSLMIKCRVNGRNFKSPNNRPQNFVIDKGFANANERDHTNPCPNVGSKAFKSFRQRSGDGSQVETPSVNIVGNRAIVSGYQHYELTPTSLAFSGHPKYNYLKEHLSTLKSSCGDACQFLDIGSNTGLVSFIAERRGFARITALDHDAPAIEVIKKTAQLVESKVNASVFSFGDILPTADVIFCGALIHWVFCLTANFQQDFNRIVHYLARSARRYLIIEWVEPNDGAIKSFRHINRCGRGAVEKYSRPSFTRALKTIGTIVDLKQFGTRVLFTVRISTIGSFLNATESRKATVKR